MKSVFYFLLTFILFLGSNNLFSAQSSYARIDLSGSVNPVVAEHISKSITDASEEGNQFVLLVIDTPGGLVNSMRDIIKSILSSSIPVVVFTSPKGAQAASAGAFIMLAADINAMSPGSEIGAMHPYSPGVPFAKDDNSSDEKDVMGMKILNDMVAYGRSLAQQKGRNQEWVEDAIINASSSTYIEAQKAGIVDYIADDEADLLSQIDGKEISFQGDPFTFKTTGIVVKEYIMNRGDKFLNFFADPQLIMILLIIAVGGLFIEIKDPGLIFPGAIGVVSLFLFLMVVRIVPVSAVGVLLITASVVLFTLEVFITSYGLLTIGGLMAFISGALLLFDNPIQGFSVSWVTIGFTGLFIIFLLVVVLRAVVSAHRSTVQVGVESFIGQSGSAASVIDFENGGKIYIHGELWDVHSDSSISKGSKVRVTGVDGMSLIVTEDKNK
ncbi:MAG: nodulation protein NfeD [Spirochaetes bacterium]|jgi:membrane-bound serine protease (ClpP class)|nr:nodulation protein NfeD [Spirochaetota bacterium]